MSDPEYTVRLTFEERYVLNNALKVFIRHELDMAKQDLCREPPDIGLGFHFYDRVRVADIIRIKLDRSGEGKA